MRFVKACATIRATYPSRRRVITYEYPLSERVRTLLRLEDLFDKIAHFAGAESPPEHHVALTTLFEILEVASRADLKFDLVQELERQRQILLSFRNNPDMSEDALNGALYEIEQASAQLLAMQGKIGHYLRENEWLMAIKNRAAIPGGCCEFDLPGYHYWLSRSSDARRQDLDGWIRPMLPIREGLAIVLRLLQEKGELETPHGRSILSMLLYQDVGVVPVMLTAPLLASAAGLASGGSGSGFQAVVLWHWPQTPG